MYWLVNWISVSKTRLTFLSHFAAVIMWFSFLVSRVKAFNLTCVMADRLKGGARNTCIEHTNSLSRHTSPSNEAGELLEQPVNLRIYLKLLVNCFLHVRGDRRYLCCDIPVKSFVTLVLTYYLITITSPKFYILMRQGELPIEPLLGQVVTDVRNCESVPMKTWDGGRHIVIKRQNFGCIIVMG